MGYDTRENAIIIQPHLTFDGRDSENTPLLHFVITSISVTIVAKRSQTCCPILTARLIEIYGNTTPINVDIDDNQGGSRTLDH